MSLPMKPALWCPGIRQGHPLARGLVAAWPWVGSANLRDVVGGSHLTAYNSPTVVPDDFGRVVEFDDGSNEYLSIVSPVVASVPYSTACWFKADDDTINHVLMARVDKDVDNRRAFLYASSANAVVAIFQGPAGSGTATTTTTWSADEWHHALAVFPSTSSRTVYLDDGGKNTDTTATGAVAADTTSIGMLRDSTPSSPMSGRIALPLMWNRALTDLEDRWLYEEPWSLITPRKRSYFWVAASGGAAPTGNPWWYYAQQAG